MGSENNQNQSVNKGNPQYEEFISFPEFSPLADESSSQRKRSAAYLSEEEQKAESGAAKAKENKIESFFRKILLPATVAVAAVVTAETIGIVGSPGVAIVGEPSVKTSTSDAAGVYCFVELEGYQGGGDELAVEVYNDFERFREPMQVESGDNPQEDGQNSERNERQFAFGEVYGMRPDTDYTMEILYGNWSLYKQKIRTAKQEEPWREEPHEDPDTGDPTRATMQFETSESGIAYFISLVNVQQDDAFVVRLLWDGEPIAQNRAADFSAEEPYLSGEFYDLQPDTEYTVQLVKNPDTDSEQTISEQSVRTQPFVEPIIEPEFSATESEIFYSIPVPDYRETDFLLVILIEPTGETRSNEVVDISPGQSYAVGSFTDLESGTEYGIQLQKNQKVVAEWAFSTQEIVIEPAEPEFSSTETEISYSIPISDFTENDWYFIYLLENGDMIAENEEANLSPDQEYVGGTFADLEPGTEYTIQLMKGQELISEWIVSTKQAEEEPWFEASESAIYYGIPIADFSADDVFTVELIEPTGGTRENDVEDLSPDEPYAMGVFADLQPETEYEIRLMKNRQLVARYVVVTSSVEEEPVEARFETTEGSITYYVPVSDIQENDWYMALLTDATGMMRESYCDIILEDQPYYVTGVFPDLDPGTEYLFRLLKNGSEDEVIYSDTVSTAQAEGEEPAVPSGEDDNGPVTVGGN